MKNSLTFALIFSTIFCINAQNKVDALRYSQLSFGGTARSMAMGGAFGALGGDFSTLSSNPAGIALYKKSEFSFSPTFFSTKATTNYNENTNNNFRTAINFNNMGYVYSATVSDDAQDAGLRNIQFGFGFNKCQNFNNKMYIEGYNGSNSILTEFHNNAIGVAVENLNSFDAGLAYDTYLMYDDSLGNYYIDNGNGGVMQYKSVKSKGAMNEMVFTVGGNYDDRLYIGATLGLPWVRYIETGNYEEVEEDSIGAFHALEMNDYLKTTGSGVNFKIGMIFRPTDWVRVGASVHTPTFFMLHDNYSRELESDFDEDFKEWDAIAKVKGSFDYKLITPMRSTASIAFIFGKVGLISADYEYIDYSASTLQSTTEGFSAANKLIDEKYRAQRNIRFGGEINLAPFTYRLGYAHYGSPFHTSINDGSRESFSTGIGFRDEDYFLDIAFVHTTTQEDYYLYDASLVNPSNNDFAFTSLLFTLGFRW